MARGPHGPHGLAAPFGRGHEDGGSLGATEGPRRKGSSLERAAHCANAKASKASLPFGARPVLAVGPRPASYFPATNNARTQADGSPRPSGDRRSDVVADRRR